MDKEIDYFKLLENPFILDIEEKLEYTNEELNNIQNQLRGKYLDYIVEDGYNENFKWPFYWVRDRCTKGLCAKQSLIDISNNVLPKKNLFKVGNGGNGNGGNGNGGNGNGGNSKNCIVCYTHLQNDRCDASESILQSLKEVGYNGHFYLFNGGFPNPSGKEMKYAGVPYSFKIFMILEAQKMGFNKVIWIDAACYAVNNPERLFDILDKNDFIFRWFPANCFETDPNIKSYDVTVLPKTLELLNKLANRDVREDDHVNSIVFGVNLEVEKVNEFISDYYDMVKLGLPFLSTFPEEIVYATILNNVQFKYVFNYCDPEIRMLYINEHYLDKCAAKDAGYFFLQRKYK